MGAAEASGAEAAAVDAVAADRGVVAAEELSGWGVSLPLCAPAVVGDRLRSHSAVISVTRATAMSGTLTGFGPAVKCRYCSTYHKVTKVTKMKSGSLSL